MAHEITDGSDPQADMTRQQMMTALYRWSKMQGRDVAVRGSLTKYADSAQVEPYAQEPFSWAVGAKLVSGTDKGLLDPNGTATRGQTAVILQRFFAESQMLKA